jgi:hypothetical protein
MGDILLKTDEMPSAVIPHKLLVDNRVSLKAKALFALISTKKILSVKSIESECMEGIHAIATGLTELESFGYLVATKFRTSKGNSMIYSLYNEPFTAIVLNDF